jgi:hypothetical protein
MDLYGHMIDRNLWDARPSGSGAQRGHGRTRDGTMKVAALAKRHDD